MANPVVHFEIGCRDLKQTSAFYRQLFGWTISDDQFAMIDTGTNGVGGHIAALEHEPHKFTHFYVQVQDIAAALAQAEALGGKTVVPPVKIPTGEFAWFADPEGNTVGLWTPKS
jgi:predicted enzyme related to lactoylglutathione lyase